MEENKDCCCNKKTIRDEKEKLKLYNRLNRIEGQIRGIKGMLEKDAYCLDILIQSSAIISALKSFDKELLAKHINLCVVNDIKEGNTEKTEELINLLSKMLG